MNRKYKGRSAGATQTIKQPAAPSKKISHLNKILLWIAGVDLQVIAQCPESEMHKHSALAFCVVFTSFLAMGSGGYAVSTIIDHPLAVIIIALFWGGFIFTIDRFLLLSSEVKKDKADTLLDANLPLLKRITAFININLCLRLGMAIVLSIVISKPLEIKIMESKIKQALLDIRIEAQKKLSSEIQNNAAGYGDAIQNLQTQQKEFQNQYENNKPQHIRTLEIELKSLEQKTNEEAKQLQNGNDRLRRDIKSIERQIGEQRNSAVTNSSQIRFLENRIFTLQQQISANESAIANIKEPYMQKRRELGNLSADYNQSFAQKNKEIAEKIEYLQTNRARDLEQQGALTEPTAQAYQTETLVDRITALAKIENDNPTVYYLGWFLMLFFIVLEMVPVVSKMFMPIGVYEKILKMESEKIILIKSEQNKKRQFLLQVKQQQIELREQLQANQQKKEKELELREKEAAAYNNQKMKDEANRLEIEQFQLTKAHELHEAKAALEIKQKQLTDEIIRIHEINRVLVKEQIEDNQKILSEVSNGHLELVRQQVLHWLEKEKNKLKNNFNVYSRGDNDIL